MTESRTFWRDPALGDPRVLDLPGGPLRVFERGSGPAIVFVHGLLVNANLWRKVVPRLAPDFRYVALDMPLGSHELALPEGAPPERRPRRRWSPMPSTRSNSTR